MSSTITDSAIILSRVAWREADKRVVFFTRNHGKIDGVAVGAHKIKSKLAGHLEPLRAVDVMVAEGRQGYKIAQCMTYHNFVDVEPDISRVRYMGTLVRFVERVAEPKHADPALYELLFRGLARVQAADEAELESDFGQALMSLAAHFGYAPTYDRCMICRTEEHLSRFSPEHGGVICTAEKVFEKTFVFTGVAAQHLVEHLKWRALV